MEIQGKLIYHKISSTLERIAHFICYLMNLFHGCYFVNAGVMIKSSHVLFWWHDRICVRDKLDLSSSASIFEFSFSFNISPQYIDLYLTCFFYFSKNMVLINCSVALLCNRLHRVRLQRKSVSISSARCFMTGKKCCSLNKQTDGRAGDFLTGLRASDRQTSKNQISFLECSSIKYNNWFPFQ